MNERAHVNRILAVAALLAAATTGLASAQDAPTAVHLQDRGGPRRDDYLRFGLKSTKVGFITSDVEGRVRDFDVSYTRDGDRVRDVRVAFDVRSMTTDNGARDEKMWVYCLDAEHHHTIEVEIPGPIPAATPRRAVTGRIEVRGEWHPVHLMLSADPSGDATVVRGHADVSLSELDIPDPSIWIAHVDDHVTIDFAARIPTEPPRGSS